LTLFANNFFVKLRRLPVKLYQQPLTFQVNTDAGRFIYRSLQKTTSAESSYQTLYKILIGYRRLGWNRRSRFGPIIDLRRRFGWWPYKLCHYRWRSLCGFGWSGPYRRRDGR